MTTSTAQLHGGQDRQRALHLMERAFELPMELLAVLWLGLVAVALSKPAAPVVALVLASWSLFVIDAVMRIALASDRRIYARTHWPVLASALLPPLRLVEPFSFMTSVRASPALLKAALATTLITVAGAAVAYRTDALAFGSYGDALWWAAMQVTTVGTGITPDAAVARVMAFVLSALGFALFAFVTATLATYLLRRDAPRRAPQPDPTTLSSLRLEISALRDEVQALSGRPSPPLH